MTQRRILIILDPLIRSCFVSIARDLRAQLHGNGGFVEASVIQHFSQRQFRKIYVCSTCKSAILELPGSFPDDDGSIGM